MSWSAFLTNWGCFSKEFDLFDELCGFLDSCLECLWLWVAGHLVRVMILDEGVLRTERPKIFLPAGGRWKVGGRLAKHLGLSKAMQMVANIVDARSFEKICKNNKMLVALSGPLMPQSKLSLLTPNRVSAHTVQDLNNQPAWQT